MGKAKKHTPEQIVNILRQIEVANSTLINEYKRECLAIHFWRRINSTSVIDVLADAMIEHGIPKYIRSDNGPESVAEVLRKWLASKGSATLYIEPGSPWENGYCESFNSKLRDGAHSRGNHAEHAMNPPE